MKRLLSVEALLAVIFLGIAGIIVALALELRAAERPGEIEAEPVAEQALSWEQAFLGAYRENVWVYNAAVGRALMADDGLSTDSKLRLLCGYLEAQAAARGDAGALWAGADKSARSLLLAAVVEATGPTAEVLRVYQDRIERLDRLRAAALSERDPAEAKEEEKEELR